jgi:hypothetical protein
MKTQKAAKPRKEVVATTTPAAEPQVATAIETKGKPAAKAKPEAKAKPAAKAKPMGVCAAIKEALIKNPKLSPEAITEELKKQGLTGRPSTVVTMRTDFRDSLSRLKAAGLLRELDL